MGLTIQEARALSVGTILSFGTPRHYTVKRVDVAGMSIRLELERDDGYETFAGESDLHKASIVETAYEAPGEAENEPSEESEDTFEAEQEAPPPHVQVRKRSRRS